MLILEYILQQKGVGLTESLVDAEGFPRSDIDVYSCRHARHQISCKSLFYVIYKLQQLFRYITYIIGHYLLSSTNYNSHLDKLYIYHRAFYRCQSVLISQTQISFNQCRVFWAVLREQHSDRELVYTKNMSLRYLERLTPKEN